MRKIYFITRSWSEKTGGVMIRKKQVKYLRKWGYKVIIVTPNYNSSRNIINSKFLKIKFTNNHFLPILERAGIICDYLEPWISDTVNILEKVVTKQDILFATCGASISPRYLADADATVLQCSATKPSLIASFAFSNLFNGSNNNLTLFIAVLC